MLVKLITGPTEEPVSLAEAKDHLRLELGDDDTTVTTLITAARQHIEEVCWRGLVTQTWERVLAGFPEGLEDEDNCVELPRGNLVSITSVTYVDAAGATQILAASEYEADTVSVPGKLRLAYGKSWPTTRDHWNAVVVRYVVGWSVATVPTPIKRALLLLVSQMYEHRTPEVVGPPVNQVKFAVDALLAPYRLVRV